MAITYNDNVIIAAPKPIDTRYLSLRVGSGGRPLPYTDTTEVNAVIPITQRYVGLTVNVANVDYWYENGVSDTDLVVKKYEAIAPVGDFFTGATNIGFFSGYTGVQTLTIDKQGSIPYDGNYASLYNYYYRGVDGKIHIGQPNDGIPKRGYVKTTGSVKSWVWNESPPSGGETDALEGWVFVDGNIDEQIGIFQAAVTYYNGTTTFPYTATSWTKTCNNGSGAMVAELYGSLTTGSSYTLGGPFYKEAINNELIFRTLRSKDESAIKISYDETFVYVSGATASGSNLAINGSRVYASTIGSTLNFRVLAGSGNTTVYESGDRIIIHSDDDTSVNTYNLSSPSTVTVGGIPSGTTLTGKTSFQLFENLLAPALYPTLTAPTTNTSLSPSGTFEIGCDITLFRVQSTFDQGCISPQYTSTCDKRSNGAVAYCYTGSEVEHLYECTSTSMIAEIPNYVVSSGAQTWGTCTKYRCGVQPKDSKGCNYCYPLTSGFTTQSTASICGIHPYYYGKLSCETRPGVTNELVTGGTKMVASSTGTVCVSFNSSSEEYTWLAIPSTSTAKTCWYVSDIDKGDINNEPSDKYPDECTISITSGQGCWSDVAYRVYMSGTVGQLTSTIQFRNS